MQLQYYDRVTRFFHWLIALLIIGLLLVGFVMTNVDLADKGLIYGLHKSFGLTVIMLMLLRIIWRFKQGELTMPSYLLRWQVILAKSTHGVLYLLGLAIPFSGWVMSVASDRAPNWFWLFTVDLPINKSKVVAGIASEVHFWLAWVLIVALVMHVIGAVMHGFGENSVLRRMLRLGLK